METNEAENLVGSDPFHECLHESMGTWYILVLILSSTVINFTMAGK